MPDITLSIVSGTYNRITTLQKMLTSVRASLPPGLRYEFVIVDGGSTDGTLDYLHTQPDVKLIEHGALLGIKKAFGDGCAVASGKYVLMANDDIEFVNHESILKALVYLENNRTCGGVAFADNRKNAYNPHGEHRVNYHPAQKNGRGIHAVYAQVGLFPRWLGEVAGWWGLDDPDFHAKNYGLDNYLSARIQELGYSIDAVEGVIVHDFAPEDDLRKHNDGHPEQGGHPDSKAFYDRFPGGPVIPDHVKIPNQTFRQLRILYLPIYERGHAVQHAQKHGLRDALMAPHGQYKGALVYEWDYMASGQVENDLNRILDTFMPDMLLTQFHGPDVVTPEMLERVRQRYGRVLIVNWNGDYEPHGLVAADMLRLLKHINLQLVVNGAVLDTYAQYHIHAAYWQIGYEEPGDDLPDVPAHAIVFLANAYKPERLELGRWLKATYPNVGLYGQGWGDLGDGECLYNFRVGKALLNNAKIVIGDNMYPKATGFVSNRLFQALAAGGAMLLHQTVNRLDALTGIVDTVHYVAWEDLADLKTKLDYFLAHDKARRRIADDGTAFIREHHSFEKRVEELFFDLIPNCGQKLQSKIGLRYTGRRTSQFGAGVGMASGRAYVCNPPTPLWVDPADVPGFLAEGLWEPVNETADDDLLARSV